MELLFSLQGIHRTSKYNTSCSVSPPASANVSIKVTAIAYPFIYYIFVGTREKKLWILVELCNYVTSRVWVDSDGI